MRGVAIRDPAELRAVDWVLDELGIAEPEPADEAGPLDEAESAEELPEPDPGPSLEEVVAELEERHARELEAAYARGRSEGEEEGRRQEAERLERAIEAAERVLTAVSERERAWAEAAEEELALLATAIARQIIGRELGAGPEIVVDLVRKAIAEFPLSQPVRIRVHPEDLAIISALSPTGGDANPRASEREVYWVPDDRIERGGCIVDGRDQIIDARVDKALERIYRRLVDHD